MSSESNQPRYSGKLVKHHHFLRQYGCSHGTELCQKLVDNAKPHLDKLSAIKTPVAIEIGCGEGELTLQLARAMPYLKICAIDIDQDMVNKAQSNLKEYPNVYVFQEDIFHHLPLMHAHKCDAFFSSWTIHNFTQDQRKDLSRQIDRILYTKKRLIGIMDKIYSEDENKAKITLQKSIEQYHSFASKYGNQEAWDAIIAHEIDDFKHPYRMTMRELNQLTPRTYIEEVAKGPEGIDRDRVIIGIS